MPQYYITSESNEDTFDATDDLQDAIRIAKKVAQDECPGETVFIEQNGRNIMQFIRTPDGRISERLVA